MINFAVIKGYAINFMNILKPSMKLLYCLLWSFGLFFVTFYGFRYIEGVFDFTDTKLVDATESHIMPMVMAMALYLGDVVYALKVHRVDGNKVLSIVLLLVIVFMVAFVFSLLANHNVCGWILFVVAWVALTALKYHTTEEVNVEPSKIPED